MAEEQEVVRCLEALRKGEEKPISSLFTVVHHNVYSCEPGELPGVPVNMDQNKKLYYLMKVTDRVMTPSGPSRKTPRGHWKSKEGHKPIINGITHGFKQVFKYRSGEPLGENTKWAMIECTLYPPKSKENKFALCYVYRTRQDGRQNNGRPHISLWDLPFQTCDDLDLREEQRGNDFPYEAYDELDWDYNGNEFPYRLGGT